jgi:hypothetical protein
LDVPVFNNYWKTPVQIQRWMIYFASPSLTSDVSCSSLNSQNCQHYVTLRYSNFFFFYYNGSWIPSIKLPNGSSTRSQNILPFILITENFKSPSPWSTVLENLIVAQPVKNFSAFYGTRRFITVFTRSRNRSSPRLCATLHLRWGVVGPRPPPTPRLEDHPLSAVRDFLFSIFAATWRSSPVPRWRGTRSTWYWAAVLNS